MAIPISGPILDFCVLAVASRGDTYGYALTQRLSQSIQLSESTLYPVLRRLKKEGYLTTYDQAHEGRNRRYYQITPAGIDKLAQAQIDWEAYVASVEDIVGGQADDT